MKKIIPTLIIIILLASCGTPGRVCGGSGGRRCVEITKKPPIEKLIEAKINS
jgi:hypothetical protein